MKGSMEQYLTKKQDFNAVDFDENSTKSDISSASTTKDCDSGFKGNEAVLIFHDENGDIDENNVTTLENILNYEVKNMFHKDDNSPLENIPSNEVKNKNLNDVEDNSHSVENIPYNEVKNAIVSEDSCCSLEVEDISNNEMNMNNNEKVIENFSPDPGLWPMVVTEEMREYFVRNKPSQFISEIHSSARFCYDKTRILTEHNFYRIRKNKEKIKREWLVYSPVKKAVFCYVCKLFSCSRQSLCDEGFTNWKNVTERLSEHENSRTHRDSILKLSSRAENSKRIDCEMVNEYNKECTYWRSVLSRVVSVIKFLAERGLPLFGDNETIGSLKNGNYLGCLELISKYDPFIFEHLQKHGNPGKGNVNYLSSTTATEILQLMSDKVLNFILSELKESKYYGLILDLTPDISHMI